MSFYAGQKLRASDLNNIQAGYEQGEWTTLTNKTLGTPTLIDVWTPYVGTNPATIAGISYSSGVFTVGLGGIYAISLSMRFSVGSGDKYCFICGTGSSDIWAKSSMSGTVVNASCSVTKRLLAGATIRMYGYSSAGGTALHESGAELTTGCTIYRLGP